MANPLLRHLVRRAFELPFRVVVRKAWGLAGRAGRAWWHARHDAWFGTYARKDTDWAGLELPLQLEPASVDGASLADLLACTAHYLRHEFDLLGTGWRSAAYGVPVPGLEGIRFAADADALAVARSGDPAILVSRANRRTSRAIYGLIDDPAYRPIDWQRDARSGYRWSNRASFRSLGIGEVAGADIKLPWELSRLQHLPQLALAALLSQRGARGLRSAQVYAREIRSQCLDFIAVNPPRFGACWGCPMDVAIRAANVVLAHAVLERAGLPLDDAYRRVLGNSIAEHAAHVARYIEWSDSGRSNHFLSDLLGLMFCAAALPNSEETRGWMAYAASWLTHDTLLQFHADGGNYEGSTGYHGLSAELVLYGIALLRRELALDPKYLSSLRHAVAPHIRGGIAPGSDAPDLLARIDARLAAMHRFCIAVQRPDGSIAQLGDTDSGRLFKLCPRLQMPLSKDGPGSAGAGDLLRENPLDGSAIIAGLAALLGKPAKAGRAAIAAQFVVALAAGNLCSDVATDHTFESEEVALDALLDEVQRLPAAARHDLDVALPTLDPAALELQGFADFGLLAARGPDFYLLLRCAAHARSDAPSGHLHDDNLGIELFAGGTSIVSDPGTYVYTPLPALRNAYREADAHFAPRAAEWSALRYSDYLFESFPYARARCLHFSVQGLAARLESPAGYVQRIVCLLRGSIRIIDSCAPGALRELSPPMKCCSGYGIRTSRPSHPF